MRSIASWQSPTARPPFKPPASITCSERDDCSSLLIETGEIRGPFVNEELVGRAIAGRRDEVVVATNFGFISHQDPSRPRLDSNPADIASAVEGSMRRRRLGARVGRSDGG